MLFVGIHDNVKTDRQSPAITQHSTAITVANWKCPYLANTHISELNPASPQRKLHQSMIQLFTEEGTQVKIQERPSYYVFQMQT
jgi:hypothetical protein